MSSLPRLLSNEVWFTCLKIGYEYLSLIIALKQAVGRVLLVQVSGWNFQVADHPPPPHLPFSGLHLDKLLPPRRLPCALAHALDTRPCLYIVTHPG